MSDDRPTPAPAQPPVALDITAAGQPPAPSAPIASPGTKVVPGAWKQHLATWALVLFLVGAAAAAWRITHPPPPAPPGAVLPVRVMRIPPDPVHQPPQPLLGAQVRVEAFDAALHTIGEPQQLLTDSMGAVNLPYAPGCALFLTLTADGYAPRELWVPHPEHFRRDHPAGVLGLAPAPGGPCQWPILIGLRTADPKLPTVPLGGIAIHFEIDPPAADPRKPAKTAVVDPPQTPVTTERGLALLTWLPNRGGTLRIEVPGCKPFRDHFGDGLDFANRYPGGVVALDVDPDAAQTGHGQP